VFAANTQAFLGINSARIFPLSNTEKHILKLVHPGIGKQQRRVTGWYQGGTRDDCMPAFAEVFQETGSDFI
jgi:hypothetical protein